MISVHGVEDLRLPLSAVAYMIEAGGSYSVPVRQFLKQEINNYVDGLEPKKRREYEDILTNVKIRESMK